MRRAERLGKYELLRHLASGGMARVYLARVDGVGGFARHLVLKTVRPERTEDQQYVGMFLDEARLIATLHHQHIAQVYDVGVADDGTHFLAMEYLHGETVRAILERARDRSERLPLDFALTIAAAAAAGLHHAHDRRGPDGRPLGIVHRDVTPSNLIAGYDGSVKLIDFGIAKAAERSTQTKTGFIKGKAGYMAPEQALGHPVDRRADVFSLGVILYELTTQTRAFRASSEFEVAHRIVRGEVTPPSVVVPGYPRELEEVVLTALARDPDERFSDAEGFGAALDRAATQLGVTASPAAVSRVLARLFGARPEPWLGGDDDGPDEHFTHTGETASLLDSRRFLELAGPEANRHHPLGFARGTDVPAVTAPSPAVSPVADGDDDDDDDGDEMPTVKFIALDEAEIIIEGVPGRGVRVVAPVAAAVAAADPSLTRKVTTPGFGPMPATRSAIREALGPIPLSAGPVPPPRVATAPVRVTPPVATPALVPLPPAALRFAHGSLAPFRSVAGAVPAPARVGVRTEQTTALAPPTARAARRGTRGIIAGAVAAAGVIAALIYLGADRSAAPTPPVAAPTPPVAALTPPPVAAPTPPVTAPTPTPATAPTPTAATAITVRVTTTPSDATVVLDGERLGRTPLVVERVRAPGKVWLKVRKQGYLTRKLEVDLGADVIHDLQLPDAR